MSPNRLLSAFVLVFFVPFYLTGCATSDMRQLGPLVSGVNCDFFQIDEAFVLAQIRAQQTCCADVSQLPFAALEQRPPSQTTSPAPTYIIPLDGPVFDFPQGKSRFLAFELPDANRMSQLHVRSAHSGTTGCKRTSPNGFRVFVPIVTFLGEDKRVIGSGVTGRPGPRDDVSLFTFRIPAGSRFAVIHSPPETYGQVVSETPPGPTVYIPVGNVFMPIKTASLRSVSTATGIVYVWTE